MYTRLSALVVSVFLLVGCSGESGSDSNRNLNTGGKDASVDAGSQLADAEADGDALDGAVLGEDAATLDADSADGSLEDASSVDAAIEGFSVTVRRGASPLGNVPVWFHGADGALLSEHSTSSEDGRVLSPTTPAMVTVLAPLGVSGPFGSSAQPITFTSLVRGDQLVLELPAPLNGGEPLPGYLLSFAAPPSGSYPEAFAGPGACALADFGYSPPSPQALPWPASCPVRATNSVLAVAWAETGEVLGYSFVKGLAPFGVAPVAAQLGAWAAPSSVQLTLSNLPQRVANVSLGLWSEGVRFDPAPQDPLPTGDEPRLLSYPSPTGFAEQVDLVVNANLDSLQTATMVVRQAPAAALTVDFEGRLRGARNGSHSLEGGRHRFAWEQDQGFAGADVAVLTLDWYVPNPDGETSTSYNWLIIAPPESVALTVPETPDSFEGSANMSSSRASVSYFERSLDDGYHSFLREAVRPIGITAQGLVHPLAVQLPAPGTLRAVTWYED